MTDSTPVTGFRARVPNILTIGRIACIPLLVAGILITGNAELKPALWAVYGTAILFFLAGLSDFLDGYWARKWNITSDFGRMIDPIADKLLVAACLIAICIVYEGHWLYLAPALAIIGRDITVSGAREFAALKGRAMPPTKLAKWKTACEMLAIALLIVASMFVTQKWVTLLGSISSPDELALHTPPTVNPTYYYLDLAGKALLWLAAILSVYTGSLYLRASLKD